MKITISISLQGVAKVLLSVVLCLTFVGVIANYSRHLTLDDYLLREMRESFVRLFSLDGEANIPAWYSSSSLLLCSMLLPIIAYAKKMTGELYILQWGFLSLIFLYLSLDEAATIHEMAIKPLQSIRPTRGFLLYAWVIPGTACVLVFVLLYLRFIFDLPAEARRLFVLAGTIYVGGALVLESLSGYFADLQGMESMAYDMTTVAEEFFEMLGVVVFIYALLLYISSYLNDVRIHINNTPVKNSLNPEGR